MCDICYISFSNAQELIEHRKTHAHLIHALECESGQLDPSISAPAHNDKLNMESSLDKKCQNRNWQTEKNPRMKHPCPQFFAMSVAKSLCQWKIW